MKSIARIFAATVVIIGIAAAVAQQPAPQPSQPIDPNAPALTVDEKIALTSDDIKKADVLEKAQKAYLEALKPIQEHQDAAKKVIEDGHPGWNLTFDQNGWHLVKKPEPKPVEKPKAAEEPKK